MKAAFNAGCKSVAQQVRVIVFAKAPIPGLAKTRLIPKLGAHGAAALAERMLKTSVAKALGAGLGTVELCVTPFEHPAWSHMDVPPGVIITDQGTGDLGERMARACARSLRAGEPVLLIGTDCPACDAPYLRDMAQAMTAHDAVIAAAADGGYPAIGLTRFDDAIFSNIAWSTSTVLQETLKKLRALRWTFKVFPELHDIDEPADLLHLPPEWLQWLSESRGALDLQPDPAAIVATIVPRVPTQ
jgi:uncharacterized protein